MSVTMPEQGVRYLDEALYDVVDLAWLTLAWRVKEAVRLSPDTARTLDAELLGHHLQLLSVYVHSARAAGDTGEWSTEALASELEVAIENLADNLPATAQQTVAFVGRALRLARSEDAAPGELLRAADEYFALMIPSQMGISAAFHPPFLTIDRAILSTRDRIRAGHIADNPFNLTKREVEVLQLMAEDISINEISRRMEVTVRTVSTHMSHILMKMEVNSRLGAVMKAVKAGLV